MEWFKCFISNRVVLGSSQFCLTVLLEFRASLQPFGAVGLELSLLYSSNVHVYTSYFVIRLGDYIHQAKAVLEWLPWLRFVELFSMDMFLSWFYLCLLQAMVCMYHFLFITLPVDAGL